METYKITVDESAGGQIRMAVDQSELKLIEWADKLSESLDRHESKDRNFVVLPADECRELIAVMLRAVGELHEGGNGA